MGILKAIGLQLLFLALLLPKDFLKLPSTPCADWQRPRIAPQSVCLGGLRGSVYRLLCNGLRHLFFQMLTLLLPRRFCTHFTPACAAGHLTPGGDTDQLGHVLSVI